MSGHNKWSSIKHKKAIVDARRGKSFTKVIREITVAARTGGGDVAMNPTLRLAVSKAKEINMPNDNVERAIKKGTGELEGVQYEEQLFEGYAPGGVALMVEVLTDNKNRSSSDIKAILGKKGGNLASQGAVAYQFKRKGFFVIPKEAIAEDDLLELVLEAGADDLTPEENAFEVFSQPEAFEGVKEALQKADVTWERAEIMPIPDTQVEVVDVGIARKILKLIDALEDCDDVQAVHENSDIPPSVLAAIEND